MRICLLEGQSHIYCQTEPCVLRFAIFQQIKHGKDAFLLLITDGINFVLHSKEACDVINQAEDPYQAARLLTDQVRNSTVLICSFLLLFIFVLALLVCPTMKS